MYIDPALLLGPCGATITGMGLLCDISIYLAMYTIWAGVALRELC